MPIELNGRTATPQQLQALRSALAVPGDGKAAPRLDSSPGTTVLDFTQGATIATSVLTSSCAVAWTADGLEITPAADGWANFTLYFDSGKQFSLWSDDGYATDATLPNIEGKPANPTVGIRIGRGATSTSQPADTRETRIFVQPTGTVYFSGRRYDRHRWDFASNDAKCGVWPGYNPGITGAGVAKSDTINWLRFDLFGYGGKTVKIHRLVRGGSSRPCLVLGTDSAAFHPLNELVSAYMARLGWRWSINQYFGGGLGVDDLAISRDVIRAIYAGGNDYNCNDLEDRNLSLAGLTQAQARAMGEACRAKAEGYGWRRGSNIFIYNNNAHTDQVCAGLAEAGFVAGRSGQIDGRFVFPEGGIVNPMRIPAASWDQATSAQMLAQVDRVIEYKASQWAYWHNVYSTARVADDGQTAVGSMTPSAYRAANLAYCSPRSINEYTVWWEELKTALDGIKAREMAGQIVVMSPSEWCAANGLPALTA
jgi:hypothetical protein